MSIFIFLFLALFLYILFLPSVKLGLKRLSCVRSFSRSTAFEGEEGEMIEVVRNDSPFIIPWLRLESRISPHLRLGKRENLDVSWQMHYCSVFTLMPRKQIRRTHKVRFLRRGVYNLGNATLTAGDFLGFSRFFVYQNLDAQVTVYPRILDEQHLPALNSLLLGELTRHRQLIEDPFLVRGIRQYVPGDPVRDIHWPATARTGQTQVRIHDYTTRSRLLVVINAQCENLQWYDRVPEEKEPTMEYGISLAATLCIRALQDGLAAGFATNMPMGDSKDPTVILPDAGSTRAEDLLTSFARLDTTCAQKFTTFMKSLESCTGLDILLLSCYDSEGIQESLAQLRRNGNRAAFHLLEGGGL